MTVVDTSVLVAFFNGEDLFFKEATAILGKSQWPLMLSESVANETLALLRKRVDKNTAISAAAQMQDPLLFDWMFSEKEEINTVLGQFIQYKAKYSYVDLVVALIAKKMQGCVLTFDSHFRELGVEISP